MAVFAVKPGADVDHQEKCLSQLYDRMPEGMTPLATLKNHGQRMLLGACSRPGVDSARSSASEWGSGGGLGKGDHPALRNAVGPSQSQVAFQSQALSSVSGQASDPSQVLDCFLTL